MPPDTPPPPLSPLDTLGAAHECLRELLAGLERLVATSADAGERDAPFALAKALLEKHEDALGLHLHDEEDDLFPAILAAAESPGRRAQAFDLVSRLMVEHREMGAHWESLRLALAACGPGPSTPFPRYTATRFVDRCRRHIESEERELADLLRGVPAERMTRVGDSIARRHGGAARVPA